MTKIQILGPGCPKCRQLAETAETAARELGIEFELEKVTGLDRILSFGVMVVPGLVVDGQVRLTGKVPNVEDMKAYLR